MAIQLLMTANQMETTKGDDLGLEIICKLQMQLREILIKETILRGF